MDDSTQQSPGTDEEWIVYTSAQDPSVTDDQRFGAASAQHPSTAKEEWVVANPAEHLAVSDEEWEAFFRRTVMLHPSATEVPLLPGSVAQPVLAPRGPGTSRSGARLWDRADSEEAGADPVSAPAKGRPTPAEPTSAALTDQEWRERFFQRGQVTGLLQGDDLLMLTAPDVRGGVTSLRLQGDALTTLAAAALQQGPTGFDWRDHDDLVLLGILLDGCLRGIPLESRPATVRDAVSGVATRYSGLIGRLAALLPPR